MISEDEGGDGAFKTYVYSLNLDQPSDQRVRVQYATDFDGEADSNDLTPKTGEVVFNPGEVSADILLQIRQDGLAEGDESLSLVFSDVENARIANPRTQLILREVQQPQLTISP